MVAPAIIGASIGAITPLLMELARSKPDPETAKAAIMAKRQELIDRAIGAGDQMEKATKDVDAQIAQEVAAADEAGSFNFPLGEMVMGGLIGAVTPAALSKIGSMFKGAQAAAPVAAKAVADVPAPSEIANAMGGGMGPFPVKSAGHVANPLIKGKPQADMSAMLAGGPFPG